MSEPHDDNGLPTNGETRQAMRNLLAAVAVISPLSTTDAMTLLRDVRAFLDLPERTLNGRRDTEHSYCDEPLKKIRERINAALEAYEG